MWGNAKIVDYWKKQRDLYKYIHDQSVNLMNKGYTGIEIAEMIKLPPELDKQWYNRGYYGTLRHNSRAVYQRYMGWYDGNPSTLDNLPPEPAAKKYVEYMGGEAAVLTEGQGGFRQGRVPLGRGGAEARRLRQSEQHGGEEPARRHLRAARLPGRVGSVALGLPAGRVRAAQRRAEGRRDQHRQPGHDQGDAARDAVRLLRRAAERPEGRGQEDRAQRQLHRPQEAVLAGGRERRAQLLAEAGRTRPMPRSRSPRRRSIRSSSGRKRVEQAITSGDLKIEGRKEAFTEFLGLLDTFPFWFNIVTP